VLGKKERAGICIHGMVCWIRWFGIGRECACALGAMGMGTGDREERDGTNERNGEYYSSVVV